MADILFLPTQDTMNAQLLELARQTKAYIDNLRADYQLGITPQSMGGMEFDIPISSVSQAFALAQSHMVKYIDKETSIYNPTPRLQDYSKLREYEALYVAQIITATYVHYLYNTPLLERVSFPSLITITMNGTNMVSNCPLLSELNFPSFANLQLGSGAVLFCELSSLESAEFPNLTIISRVSGGAFLFRNCILLRRVYMPALTTLGGSYYVSTSYFEGCTNLIDIHIGSNINGAGTISGIVALHKWNPSGIYSDASKVQLLNTNIRDHIAANLQDKTGSTAGSIYFSSSILSHFEQETRNAITSKNWTIISV